MVIITPGQSLNAFSRSICVLHKNGCYSTRLEIIERITTIKGSQVTVREALSEQFKILENSDVVGERFERCVCAVKLSHKIQVLIKIYTDLMRIYKDFVRIYKDLIKIVQTFRKNPKGLK